MLPPEKDVPQDASLHPSLLQEKLLGRVPDSQKKRCTIGNMSASICPTGRSILMSFFTTARVKTVAHNTWRHLLVSGALRFLWAQPCSTGCLGITELQFAVPAMDVLKRMPASKFHLNSMKFLANPIFQLCLLDRQHQAILALKLR